MSTDHMGWCINKSPNRWLALNLMTTFYAHGERRHRLLYCFPFASHNCVDWLANPSVGGCWLHQTALWQQPGGQDGDLPVATLLALPLLGSSHPAGLQRGCRGFPLLLLGEPWQCWIPTSLETMVAVEEVVVFCRVTHRLTAAHGGRASQGEEMSYHNIFVYWEIALIYQLSAMLHDFASEASPFASCFVNA